RRGAVEGLAMHPSSEGVRMLSQAAYTDPSPSVRRASVESLGRFQTQEALEALIAIAGQTDDDKGTRRAAFDALGQKVSEQEPQPPLAADAKSSPAKPTPPPAKADAKKFDTPEMKAKADKQDKSGQKQTEQEPQDERSQPLDRGDEEVQRQAIESLGRYPEAQSLPRLKK